jgi:adenylate cyclase
LEFAGQLSALLPITAEEPMHQKCTAILALTLLACLTATTVKAADCDEAISRHMIGEAMLAAQYVALAEKAGMTPLQINAVLKTVAEASAIEEFWITDPAGHAYLTNTGIDFTFSPDPGKQAQASAFWALIDGQKKVVVQEARKREIDNRIFKYVGVAGVDKPRIVQVGVSEKNLGCK